MESEASDPVRPPGTGKKSPGPRFLGSAPVGPKDVPRAIRFLRTHPIFWGVVFVGGVTLLLAPWFFSSNEPLVPGLPSTFDVIAERDLSILDESESADRRHRTESEVPLVYNLDPETGAEIERRLAQSFDRCRAVLREKSEDKWRLIETSIELPMARAEVEAFAARGFDSGLQTVIRDLLRNVYGSGVVGVATPGRGFGLVLRDLSKGEEHFAPSLGGILSHNAGVREFVEEKLRVSDPGVSHQLRREIGSFVARIATPNVNYDGRETERRRREAAARVGDVFIRIPRGTLVLRSGDVVTPNSRRLALAVGEANRARRYLRLIGGSVLMLLLVFVSWPLLLRATGSGGRTSLSFSVALVSSLAAFAVTDGLARVVTRFGGGIAIPSSDLLPALPHAAGAFLAGLIAGAPAAAIAAVLGAAATGLLFGEAFRWVLFPLVASLAAAFAFERPRSRGAVAKAGLIVGVIASAASVALGILSPYSSPGGIFREAIAAFLCGPISAALATFLVPALESLFGVATDLRLLELSNQNLPLLQRLAIEAPGTYQHSLLVGNLCEAAAEAIGANPLLARVAGYYHDIGKVVKPGYFIENTRRGENKHDHLAPSMSALIIANHVREGVILARKARLPEVLVDGIRSHHGTKPIRYFFQKAVALSAGRTKIVEDDFRYPGPKPRARELGILLLADAVEAASRTLIEPSSSGLAGVVDAIIEDALRDGQLDNCQLTIEEIEKVRAAFLRTLAALFHHRIDYPGFDFNRFAERRKRHAHESLTRRAAQASRPGRP